MESNRDNLQLLTSASAIHHYDKEVTKGNVNHQTQPTALTTSSLTKNPLPNSSDTTSSLPSSSNYSSLKSFISGGLGGVCLVLIGHPMDLMKVHMQVNRSKEGLNIGKMVKDIMGKRGWRGWYRGVGPPLLGVVPIMATSVWGYHQAQQLGCKIWNKEDSTRLESWQKAAAGGLSALPTTVWVAPGERIKVILQTAPSTAPQRGMLEVARTIYSSSGLVGLYRGTLATLLRDVPSQMVYYCTYDLLKASLSSPGSETSPSFSTILLAGGLAGVFSWVVAVPPDVIKSRIQTSPKPLTLTSAYQQLIKTEGYSGLTRGMAPALLRAFPANAAFFCGVETSRYFLDQLF